MRIVLSKDRAAQCDLLLASLARNAPAEDTCVIWRASSARFREGYALLIGERLPDLKQAWLEQAPGAFEASVRGLLSRPAAHFSFFCDDDVLFRRPPALAPAQHLDAFDDLICFSLRLGENTLGCYTQGGERGRPAGLRREGWWDWRVAEEEGRCDFGYPGSLDGHVFRRADLLAMLSGRSFSNPSALEDMLQEGCRELGESRPLVAAYAHSVLVSIPANRVSEQSQVRHGSRESEGAEALNDRFLAGARLSLARMDFSAVRAAHQEIPLIWRLAGEAEGHAAGDAL